MHLQIRGQTVRESILEGEHGVADHPAGVPGRVRVPGLAEVEDEGVELEEVQERADFARPADLS